MPEPHDPEGEQEDDTTEPNFQDPNEHEECGHDADSNPSFDEVPHDEPEDELESWVDFKVRATHKADDLLAALGITSWILEKSRIHWKQARMIANQNEGRWAKQISNWNPAASAIQKGY